MAIVTGGGHPQGIGYAIATAFASEGATVVVADLAEIESMKQVEGVSCDVTDPEMVDAVVKKVAAAHGHLDILVNSAGVGVGSGDFMELVDSDWELSFSVNVRGIANMCRAVIPFMRKQKGSSIINIASLAGLGAIENMPACYTASKFAVIGLTKQIALQFAKEGIRCNAICPGSVITQMHEQSLRLLAEECGVSIEEAQSIEESRVPLGRSASPQEIAHAAVYLSSDLSSYTTGTAITVAGGMAPGL